jgi:OmpA-OmpF porin, OOP family
MVRGLMRAHHRGLSVTLLAAFALVTTEASAQQCANPLISTCINGDTYWPHAGPQRFAAVGGTETLPSGQVGFGLVTSYQSRPVVLRLASPGPGGSDQAVIDNQVNANFLFAYGVTNRLQLDLALPITLVQSGAGTSPLTGGASLRDTAVRDMRFGFAFALVPRERVAARASNVFALAARMTFGAPIGDNIGFAGERSLVWAPSLAADLRFDRLFFGAEVGARVRPVSEFAGARVGTQLTTALGGGVDILKNQWLSGLVEGRAYVNFVEQHDTLQSAFGITSSPNGKHIVPAEWLVAARSAPFFAGDLSFLLGGGGPIPITDGAITTPRFRFVLGVTYAPLAIDSDGDGVPDRIDRCPSQAGERGGDRPGCPHEEPHAVEKP